MRQCEAMKLDGLAVFFKDVQSAAYQAIAEERGNNRLKVLACHRIALVSMQHADRLILLFCQ
jgi:hypothetical protein